MNYQEGNMKTNNPSKTEYVIVKCNCELYQLSSVVTKEINWFGRTIIKEFKNFVCEGRFRT